MASKQPRSADDREPEPCSPGSIEQQLDMCETGELRGDEVEHTHGAMGRAADPILNNYSSDMAEENREGDELSGDDHAAGLQGGDSTGTETADQPPEAVKRLKNAA